MDLANVLEYIAPLIKNMKKCNKFLIYDDKLIGMNNESSIMYTMNIMKTNTLFAFDNSKEIKMSHRLYYELLDKYNYLSNSINNRNIICEMENMETDEVFSNLLKLKAKDPMHSYILDNIYLPIFQGYLPVNKGDTLRIKGCMLEDNTNLIMYTIYKKKLKMDMNIYIRLLPII